MKLLVFSGSRAIIKKMKRQITEIAILLLLSLALLQLGTSYYIVMGVAIVLIVNFELQSKDNLKDLGITRERAWESIKVQLPFTIVGVVGLLIFAFLAGYEIMIPDAQFASYWLISVPLQEFLFRGYAQKVLRGVLPMFWNVAFVSLVFGFSHYFAQSEHYMVLIATTLLAGFAWGYPYEKERNLIGPIFSHMVLGTLIFLILPAYGI
jgi:membrane protease YdiL (CAAX protease family)